MSEYVVTYRSGVVHLPTCKSLDRALNTGAWTGTSQFSGDRPCLHCIGPKIPNDPRRASP